MDRQYDFAAVTAATPAALMPTVGFVGAGKGGQTLAAAPALEPTLRRLAVLLGGRPLVLQPETKPVYHAAAVITSNYAVTLVSTSAALLAACGLERDAAVQALLPLLTGTLANLGNLGLPQ